MGEGHIGQAITEIIRSRKCVSTAFTTEKSQSSEDQTSSRQLNSRWPYQVAGEEDELQLGVVLDGLVLVQEAFGKRGGKTYITYMITQATTNYPLLADLLSVLQNVRRLQIMKNNHAHAKTILLYSRSACMSSKKDRKTRCLSTAPSRRSATDY